MTAAHDDNDRASAGMVTDERLESLARRNEDGSADIVRHGVHGCRSPSWTEQRDVAKSLRELQRLRAAPTAPQPRDVGLTEGEREALACADYYLVTAAKMQATAQRAHEIEQYAATLRTLASRAVDSGGGRWVAWKPGDALPTDALCGDVFHVRWTNSQTIGYHAGAVEGECHINNFKVCGVIAYYKYSLSNALPAPPPYAPPAPSEREEGV